jgi:V/A-type H+-transporting ATPase subunit C
MAAIVPGGFNLSQAAIDELYRAQNVTSVLRGYVRSRYPTLSALLSSETSDSMSRLLLIRAIMEEIMKYEVHRILTGYPFTIGIVLAYFLLKRRELSKLRIILNAKQYGVERERIESML